MLTEINKDSKLAFYIKDLDYERRLEIVETLKVAFPKSKSFNITLSTRWVSLNFSSRGFLGRGDQSFLEGSRFYSDHRIIRIKP